MTNQTTRPTEENMREFFKKILDMDSREFLLMKGVVIGIELNRPPKDTSNNDENKVS